MTTLAENEAVYTAFLEGLNALSNNQLVQARGGLIMMLDNLREMPELQNRTAEMLCDRLKDDLTSIGELLRQVAATRALDGVRVTMPDNLAAIIENTLNGEPPPEEPTSTDELLFIQTAKHYLNVQ